MSWFERYLAKARRNHFLYVGVPFLSIVAIGPYLFSQITQIRYDFHDQRTRMLSKREQLGLEAEKRPLDVREEYFKLASGKDLDDWDFVRVPRPQGTSDNVWTK